MSAASPLEVVDVGGVAVGVARGPSPAPADELDVVVSAAEVDVGEALSAMSAAVASAPIASLTLCQVLRLTSELPVELGLLAESFAYSTLLAGPEFAAWLAGRDRQEPPAPAGPTVRVERLGDRLEVVLSRPERRNAYGRQMRDELVEALTIVDLDPSVTEVEVRGEGAAFCSGGDLDEFGTAPDPATAHVIRTVHSAAALLHRNRDRIHVSVHGACVGAGAELPAFAARVTATDDAYFQLPEVSMGLIPGAGGTVGIAGRIGRWRTAYLALTGGRLDAATALAWGLVDELRPGAPVEPRSGRGAPTPSGGPETG